MLLEHHDLEDAEIVHGEFLESGGDATCFLDPTDAALDLIATATCGAIELPGTSHARTGAPPCGWLTGS